MKTEAMVDIIFPEGLKEASAQSLKLCELIITGLLKSSDTAIELSVNINEKSIACSDQNVREIIRMIMGAGRIETVLSQLKQLLHPAVDSKALGELKLNISEDRKSFVFYERNCPYSWNIIAH